VDKNLVEKFVLRDQWTSAAYYRLFFSSLLPVNIERLLYLDCDTLVINPLTELFQLPLDGHPVGAVYDNYVKTQPAIGIFEEGEYFNSGVLLMDLAKWRQQAISEKTFAYLTSYPDRIRYVDQCALNAVLKRNWRKLDFRFNLMYSALPEPLDQLQMKKYLKEVTIIHFTLQRPWQMLCRNRLRFLYFHYLPHSGSRFFFWNYYSDFKMRKIPEWLRIRAIEFYFDTPFIQRIWRSFQAR
jgi:lipopolysaccharide biosynthesis glycosyltransferase